MSYRTSPRSPALKMIRPGAESSGMPEDLYLPEIYYGPSVGLRCIATEHNLSLDLAALGDGVSTQK